MAKVKIPSSGYYFDWQSNTLYMTYRFSVKANNIGGDEYNIYDKFSARFPSMKVVVEAPPKRKSDYIPYNKMILYISYQENAEKHLAEFKKVREESNSYNNPYKHVYDWFTSTFSDYGKPFKKAS